jgi:hypothetical protein
MAYTNSINQLIGSEKFNKKATVEFITIEYYLIEKEYNRAFVKMDIEKIERVLNRLYDLQQQNAEARERVIFKKVFKDKGKQIETLVQEIESVIVRYTTAKGAK